MKTVYNIIDFLMNLQLFAYDPTAQPANNTGAASLSAENKTFYDMTLLDEAKAKLVHGQFAMKKRIPKNHGKTIELRKFAPLAKATKPLTEGVTPDGKTMSVSTITATMNQFGDFIAMTDVIQFTAIDPIMLQAVKLLGNQAGLTIDTLDREALHLGTNVGYASSWSGTTETTVSLQKDLTAANKLTVLEVQKAVRALRRKNAPAMSDGYYVCIIHPDVAFDLRRDPEWTDAHKYVQPEEMYKGEIGRIGGVRFIETTEAKIYWGADLSAASRTLTAGATSASKTVSVSETLVANALVGRKVIIGSVCTTVTANTTGAITVEDTITCDASTVVYPGEGGAQGIAVYGCLFLGKDAYVDGEVEGGGMETIIQAPTDPLHQKSTAGWKCTNFAKIVYGDYIYRLMCGSSNSAVAQAN